MFRPLRTIISLLFIGTVVWCSFKVPLGDRTFSEHADRIGQTPEARDLLDGTRSTVTPMVEEVRNRVLGEYIEAPTGPKPGDSGPATGKSDAAVGRARTFAGPLGSSSDPKLPGR